MDKNNYKHLSFYAFKDVENAFNKINKKFKFEEKEIVPLLIKYNDRDFYFAKEFGSNIEGIINCSNSKEELIEAIQNCIEVKLELILCTNKDFLIGDTFAEGNGLLWHSKEDLKYFSEKTKNKILIVGETTSKYMPVEKIQNSKNRLVEIFDGTDTSYSAYCIPFRTSIICGGKYTYEYFLKNKKIDKIYLNILKDNVQIKEAKKPLYLDKSLIYNNFEVVKETEFEDFTAYELIPKRGD